MSTASPTSDRREKKRHLINLRVEFKIGNEVSNAQTGDLSEGGLFLATPRQAAPGERIYLRIHLSLGGPQVKAVGEVRRVVKPGEGPLPGLGVEFETIYSDRQDVLRKFLTQGLGRVVDEAALGTAEAEKKRGTKTLSKYTFEPKTPVAGKAAPPRKRVEDRVALKELQFSSGLGYWIRNLRKPLIVALVAVGFYYGMTWALEALENLTKR